MVRFIGLANAAIWLGGAVFFLTGVERAVTSGEMQSLLTTRHFPYFSGAISQMIAGKYWSLHVVCGIIALLHLGAEALYLGRAARKGWILLLGFLLCFGLAQKVWVQPRVGKLHLAAHAVNRPMAERQKAQRAYKTWHGIGRGLEWLMVAGLGVYLWRVANPADPTRFLTPAKYRY